MGKYMRKRRPIGQVTVADGSLGVRTRAKALAESNRDSLRLDDGCGNASRSSSLESRTQRALSTFHHQDGLMVLRSRLILKSAAETSFKIAGNRLDADTQEPARDSADGYGSTQQEFVPSLTRLTGTASSGVSVSLPTRQAYGILTRRRTQELANRVRQEYDPEIDLGVVSSAPKSSAYCLQPSAVVDVNASACPAASSKTGTGASCTRSNNRRVAVSPSNIQHLFTSEQDAPPPLSKTDGAPSSSELNAFFRDAEKEGTTRFIERYNFDPTTGTPMAGRYEWSWEESSCNG